ncbi:hypothetical protein R3X28_00675 [Maribacter sp. TH_r10]|nr:hypothetical protein [Maribacter sp. TH_r10]MDV7137364.1 hypothetical protein [Maribacter sp. TH_r10]
MILAIKPWVPPSIGANEHPYIEQRTGNKYLKNGFYESTFPD